MKPPVTDVEASIGAAYLPSWHGVLVRILAALLTAAAIAWNFDVPQRLGYAFLSEQFYAFCLGLTLAIVFLSIGYNRLVAQRISPVDLALAFTALATLLYVSYNFLNLRDREYAGSTAIAITLGAVISLLVLEGLRRTSGYIILSVVVVFLLYGPLGHLVPGPLMGAKIQIWQVASNMGFNSSAIFGMPLHVATTIIIVFILFGQILFRAGGGQFFTDIAMAAMGRRKGGAAKIAIVGSAAFGSVSGSAISNVVTTGIITIPLMRKSGYSAAQAGAIEAVASTGGQLMPPVMGAAAFLMAEFLQVPYTQVALAALLPAILYYFAVFVQVDLIARRENISVVEDSIPRARDVLRQGWYFVIPFAFLIYALFHWNMRPETAAIWSCLIMLVGGFTFSYGGTRLRLSDLYPILHQTGTVVVDVMMIVAAAGMVIGILNLTGLGFALTFVLVDMADGNMWLTMAVTAVVCIILGMGLPTAASYVLLAALAAPAMIEAGVPPLAAHLFILYFGMMSMITPPIALAAFAAASLTKAGPMQTGLIAMALGWVAYAVPFLFVVSPGLLMQGSVTHIVADLITALFGTFLISVAFVGYFVRPLGIPFRVIVSALGVLSFKAVSLWGMEGLTSGGAITAAVGLLAAEYLLANRTMRTEAAITVRS